MSRNERFEQLAETVADVVLTSSAGWKNQQPQGGALAQCGSTRFLSTGLNNSSNLGLRMSVCVCVCVCCMYCCL